MFHLHCFPKEHIRNTIHFQSCSLSLISHDRYRLIMSVQEAAAIRFALMAASESVIRGDPLPTEGRLIIRSKNEFLVPVEGKSLLIREKGLPPDSEELPWREIGRHGLYCLKIECRSRSQALDNLSRLIELLEI